jgi:hypothetical protein
MSGSVIFNAFDSDDVVQGMIDTAFRNISWKDTLSRAGYPGALFAPIFKAYEDEALTSFNNAQSTKRAEERFKKNSPPSFGGWMRGYWHRN